MFFVVVFFNDETKSFRIIEKAVKAKFKIRGGMDTLEKLEEPKLRNNNRSMITIGG